MTKTEDLAISIAKIDECVKSAHKRLDKQEQVIETIYQLASDTRLLAQAVSNLQSDFCEFKKGVEEKNNEPYKLWFNVKNTVITGVIMALVSAMMVLILK